VFERFTERARRVVVLAQEEARLLNHNYIGTEHILLGLLGEGEGLAGWTLVSLGVSLNESRALVQEIIGSAADPATGYIPFTPRAKKVLELSLREALQLGHNYIGTEHLLLGLIREGEGVAMQVLVRSGVEPRGARERLLAEVASGQADEGDAEPGPIDALLIENRRLRGGADNFRRALAEQKETDNTLPHSTTT